MVPYIALLIVLIVAILFAVYKRVDTFEIQGVTVTESTPIQTVLGYVKKYKDLNESLKETLDSGDEFDEQLTEAMAKELGMSYSTGVDGTINYEKPLSKALSSQIEMDLSMLKNISEKVVKGVESGEIEPTMTVREFMIKNEGIPENATPPPIDLSFLNDVIRNQVKTSNAREAFILKKLGKVSSVSSSSNSYPELTCPGGRAPFSQNGKLLCRNLVGTVSETPLTCPTGTTPFFVFEPSAKAICVSPTLPYPINPEAATSGGTIQPCRNGDMVGLNAVDNSQQCIPNPTTVTAASSSTSSTGVTGVTGGSSAKVAGVSADDLFEAVGGVQQALKASKPGAIQELQAAAPKQSTASTKEMEDRIAKSVATQLKDSLLIQRATKNVSDDMACPHASYKSDSVAQGSEFTQARPHPGPDMSEYIRKDSIPCWKCSLP